MIQITLIVDKKKTEDIKCVANQAWRENDELLINGNYSKIEFILLN